MDENECMESGLCLVMRECVKTKQPIILSF